MARVSSSDGTPEPNPLCNLSHAHSIDDYLNDLISVGFGSVVCFEARGGSPEPILSIIDTHAPRVGDR